MTIRDNCRASRAMVAGMLDEMERRGWGTSATGRLAMHRLQLAHGYLAEVRDAAPAREDRIGAARALALAAGAFDGVSTTYFSRCHSALEPLIR